MTTETVSVLASVSKTFIGAALMTLYDQGRFALDDPINDHLPFEVVHPDFDDVDITFRMLLTHQSGLIDGDADLEYEGDPEITLEDFVRGRFLPDGDYYSEDHYGEEPGTEFEYTNDGIALMGYLVEAISGTSFEAYSQQSLFEPLGMTATSWFLSGVDGQVVARPHEPDGTSFVTLPHPGFGDFPAGQLRSSAAQVARFLQMFQDDGSFGGRQVLESETAAAMLTVADEGAGGERGAVGLVWFRSDRGGRTSWEHDGSIFGYTTHAAMLTEEDVNVVLLSNGEARNDDDVGVELEPMLNVLLEYGATRRSTSLEDASSVGVVLEGVAPNPVASDATVRFHLGRPADAAVEVFDALGRRVAVLANGPFAVGSHQVAWSTARLSSGAYVVRLRAGGTVATRAVSVVTR